MTTNTGREIPLDQPILPHKDLELAAAPVYMNI